jgi:hypothetical protein
MPLTGLAMKIKRRETEVFSLSFLDVICCGFGAIILLLVLTERVGRPVADRDFAREHEPATQKAAA